MSAQVFTNPRRWGLDHADDGSGEGGADRIIHGPRVYDYVEVVEAEPVLALLAEACGVIEWMRDAESFSEDDLRIAAVLAASAVFDSEKETRQ